MSTKQLYEKTSEGMKEVNPFVAIEDIYSKLSDTPLEALVSLYNHVKCEWKGSVADTRRTVPLFLRRSGLFITYNNGTKYITEFFSAGTDQITKEGWVKDSNWTSVPDEDYISAGVKPGVGSIGYEQLNDNLKKLFREKVNVTNYPDDEDIASVDNMLKLKDREVDIANFQSKGYVILRKNLCLVNGVVKNILTQNMVSKANTIYEIRYDFDLNGGTISFPEDCILKFEGGCLNNGNINFNNTSLESSPVQIFNNIEISGEANIDKSYCEWFGGGFNCDDSTNAIKQALKLKANEFVFYKGIYNVSNTLIFDYSNIRINQTATVKAIANMDCLILFDFASASTGGIYGISTLNYITGGGCVDGNGLANICIALNNILHSRVYNLKIKNGKQYCLELDYKDYNSGYCYIDNLEIYNELLIKDAVGIHANRSDSNFSNIQLIDFKYSILAEKDANYYYIHGWALNKNFYLDNDCEIWKESALVKVKDIQDIYFINCENDTLRYLVTKDNSNINYKPVLHSIYHRTYNNTGIIPLEILNKYPQMITSSKDINVHNYTNISNINPLVNSKIIKLSLEKNKTGYANFTFYGYSNSNIYSYFCLTMDSNNVIRIYNNTISNNASIYFKSEEDSIDIYIELKGSNILDKSIFSNTITISYPDNIPTDATNLLEKNIHNVVLISNYFKKLSALDNYKYINIILLTYVEEINKFVFINNKTFKYLSLKETRVTSGTTDNRPTVTDIGFQYFDSTLNKPIWWTGEKWVDATGADV